MQILFDSLGLTILHDEANRWLYVTWRGLHPGQSAQHCCEVILTHVRLTGSVKILNDGSQDLDGWEAAVRWAVQEFFPLLAKSGVTAFAWVRPHNLRAQTDMYKALYTVAQPAVDVFADVESAYRWLCWHASLKQAE